MFDGDYTLDGEWQRDGVTIDGATEVRYEVADPDVGHELRCRVRATRSQDERTWSDWEQPDRSPPGAGAHRRRAILGTVSGDIGAGAPGGTVGVRLERGGTVV